MGRVARLGTSIKPVIERLEKRALMSAAAGDLDTTFGDAGITLGWGAQQPLGWYYNDLRVLDDGKILAVGQGISNGFSSFGVFRMNADGTPDTTFGVGGAGYTHMRCESQGTQTATAMAIQFDGKIVVTGYRHVNSPSGTSQFLLARFNADGTPDATFDGDGFAHTNFAAAHSGRAVALQPDGKILVTGEHWGDFATARFNSDGSLDTTFGLGGVVRTDFNGRPDAAYDIAVQSDGRIVVAGTAQSTTSDHALAVVRYNPDGSLDTRFDGDGRAAVASNSRGVRMHLAADGKVTVAGLNTRVARFNADGSLDATFGVNGVAPISVISVNDMWVDTQGRVLLAGSDWDSAISIVRLTATGTADASFGTGGRVSISVAGGVEPWDKANSVAVDAQGRIVIGASVNYAGLAMLRLHGEAVVDPPPVDPPPVDPPPVDPPPVDPPPVGPPPVDPPPVDPPPVDPPPVEPPPAPTPPPVVDIENAPFIFDAAGILRINGTAGNDVIAIRRRGNAYVAAINADLAFAVTASSVKGIVIDAKAGNDLVVIFKEIGIGVQIYGGDGNDLLIGGDFADSITGGAGKDRIEGGEGDDRLAGSGGHDALIGGGGRDRLYGDAGDDRLEAGAGVDRLWGGLGNDLLAGGGGNDKLYGGDGGDDIFAGGTGDDWYNGIGATDTVYAEPALRLLDTQTSLLTLIEGFENIL